MSNYVILPGFGGAYDESVTTVAGLALVNSNTFDMSKCAGFEIQVKAWTSGDLSVQPQYSLDNTTWSDLGTSQPLALGVVVRFPFSGGPYPLVRFGMKSTDTSAAVVLRIVGYPVQWSW